MPQDNYSYYTNNIICITDNYDQINQKLKGNSRVNAGWIQIGVLRKLKRTSQTSSLKSEQKLCNFNIQQLNINIVGY